MNALVPLPVLLPLCATGLSLAFGTRLKQFQRIISVAVLTAVLALSVALMIAADSRGPLTVHLGDFAPPIGITLVADRLSGLMLTVSSAVTLCVLVYSLGQGMADRDEETPVAVFHPAYLILVGGVSCTFLAGDLVNLYVGFEIMLVASFVLLTLGGTGPGSSGSTYVIISLFSSMLFLTAIAMTYAATGTANLAQLAQRLGELPLGVQTLIQAMLLTVFAIKAAVFPLAAWLPDSYPTAPAPVTAVFAGLLTKVGVYCMLRTETLLFPGNRLGDLLMAAALASMMIGILGAVAQTDLKRLLSFILISHIGYMVFGIGLASREAYGGAIVYVAHHITVQTTLFLVAGLIERRTGTTELTRIGGLARAAPLLAALFFVPAMNLAGIPPLSGFIGKLGLMRAGVADGSAWAWILVMRLGGDQPADAVRDGQGLEPGVLAGRTTRPGRGRHRPGVRRRERQRRGRRRGPGPHSRHRRRTDPPPAPARRARGRGHPPRPCRHHHDQAADAHDRRHRGSRRPRTLLHRARRTPDVVHRPHGGRTSRTLPLHRGGARPVKRWITLSYRNAELPPFSCEFMRPSTARPRPSADRLAHRHLGAALVQSELGECGDRRRRRGGGLSGLPAAPRRSRAPAPPVGRRAADRLSALRHVHLGREGHPADLRRPSAPGRRHRRTAALPLRPDARGDGRRRVERARRIRRRGTPRHGHRLRPRPRRGPARRARRGQAIRLANGTADGTGVRHPRRDRPGGRTTTGDAADGRAGAGS